MFAVCTPPVTKPQLNFLTGTVQLLHSVSNSQPRNRFQRMVFTSLCSLCGNLETIYGSQEPRRNRIFVPARQATYRLAEPIPWNRFLGPLKVQKFGLWRAGTTESIPWNRFLRSLNVYKFRLGTVECTVLFSKNITAHVCTIVKKTTLFVAFGIGSMLHPLHPLYWLPHSALLFFLLCVQKPTILIHSLPYTLGNGHLSIFRFRNTFNKKCLQGQSFPAQDVSTTSQK